MELLSFISVIKLLAQSNIFILISLFSFDFHIFFSLFKAFHANPILTSMSFLLPAIHKPRYLKSPTCFNISSPSVFKYVSAWLNIIISSSCSWYAAQQFLLQFPILLALFVLVPYSWKSR